MCSLRHAHHVPEQAFDSAQTVYGPQRKSCGTREQVPQDAFAPYDAGPCRAISRVICAMSVTCSSRATWATSAVAWSGRSMVAV